MSIKKFIGSKSFYKMLLALAVPMIIQNGITNFVNLLDNIMVGQLGTEQISGVGIANQLIFVYTLCIFGGLSGAGIFTAQYFGKSDVEGMRHTFRFKLILATAIVTIGTTVLLLWGEPLISLFLTDDGKSDPILTLQYGMQYMRYALIAQVPMAFSFVYSSTLRETGRTVPPMLAGVIAVFTNGICNYLLIFGIGIFPELGVVGAALGTIAARVVELSVVVLWTHTHKQHAPYIRGVYRSLRIPASLVAQISVKGIPLLANELLWSLGMTILNQCYSTRGLTAVAAVNIATTISNLFNIFFLSMGSAVSIIVGNQLGAGQVEEAKDTDRKIIAFSCAVCTVIGAGMAAFAPLITQIYNVTDDAKELAAILIIIYAVMMPFNCFTHNCYFTLRSGGQTFITFLFDSAFVWGVSVPLAFILSRLTTLTILPLFICCVSVDLVKCVIGLILLKTGIWAKRLV